MRFHTLKASSWLAAMVALKLWHLCFAVVLSSMAISCCRGNLSSVHNSLCLLPYEACMANSTLPSSDYCYSLLRLYLRGSNLVLYSAPLLFAKKKRFIYTTVKFNQSLRILSLAKQKPALVSFSQMLRPSKTRHPDLQMTLDKHI